MMKKGIAFCLLLALSGSATATEQAYSGPDCSKDSDGRIFGGIVDSLDLDKPANKKHEFYFDQFIGKGVTRKITRLSSEKISKQEARRLMLRRAKMYGYNEEDIKNGGLDVQYLKMDLYKQYYLIESSKGFKAIAKFYSAFATGPWPQDDKEAEACGVDLEDIYIISDRIYGHTNDFASW